MRPLKVETVTKPADLIKIYSNQTPEIFRQRIINQSTVANKNGYVASIKDNLIQTVLMDDFFDDLNEGDVNELKNKFYPLCSSYALSVNFFGFFKRHLDKFSLTNEDNFTAAQFEKKLPTGLEGTPPNLDFYLENKNTIIGIESKFLDLLKLKEPKFFLPYTDRFLKSLDKGLPGLVNHFGKNATPTFLDTTQLIKHCIALLNHRNKRNVKLIYVYWQPVNVESFPFYKQHKDELKDFSERVKAISSISFHHFTYWELSNKFATNIFFRQHLQHFKDRYFLSIKS